MTENLSSPTDNSSRSRNIIIALVAITLSVSLALGWQSTGNPQSLEGQAQQATPLEVAVHNGKPSLIEFYANWCTTCQSMAKDLAAIKQEYDGRLNFVMLNVDNSKWLPEVLHYGVDGIPHFVFLNQSGNAIAQTVGEQPLSIVRANLDALVANKQIPHAFASGKASQFNAKINSNQGNQDNPLNHG